MTLTNRVSSFFLGWLALSLAGFAGTVYLLARSNLYQQADQRLEGTLNTLAASAEVDERGFEWEPNEREVPRVRDEPAWAVATADGVIVDRANESVRWLLPTAVTAPIAPGPAGSRWLAARRTLANPETRASVPAKSGEIRYPSLELVAALPVEPIESQLRRLGIWLALTAAILWLLAALSGRWLCRRTLAPVTQMASAAAALGPHSPGERLKVQPTGDELADLGNAFNGALNRLEEAFARQQRFTVDAAHQLRTPLTAMLGHVEVALRRDRDGPKYRDTLQGVAGEIRHLHRLTEALLFLARADADARHPDLQDVDLPGWLETHKFDWRTRYPNIRVEGVKAATVRTHPELLAQLVENLLDNAAKHGTPNGPIVVRLAQSKVGTELTVDDSGPGINADDLPHVFDPFFRAQAAREGGAPGVGLGLAIAKRIAGAMHAELWVTSAVGRGSSFTLRFPPISTSV